MADSRTAECRYKETPLYVGHEQDKLRQRERLYRKQKEAEAALLRQADRSKASPAVPQEEAGTAEGTDPVPPSGSFPSLAAAMAEAQGPSAANPFLSAPLVEDPSAPRWFLPPSTCAEACATTGGGSLCCRRRVWAPLSGKYLGVWCDGRWGSAVLRVTGEGLSAVLWARVRGSTMRQVLGYV